VNSKLYMFGLALILSAFIISGCESTDSTATPFTGGAVETVVQPTLLPTSAPPVVPANAADVTYEGISFSFSDAIASGVTPESVAAGEQTAGGVGVLPAYIKFLFDGYALPETFHQPRMYVYPVADLIFGLPAAETIVADLSLAGAKARRARAGSLFAALERWRLAEYPGRLCGFQERIGRARADAV